MKIHIPTPVKYWKVKSKSQPNTYHTVGLWTDGKIKCTCTAGHFGNECRHIKLVKKIIEKNNGNQ